MLYFSGEVGKKMVGWTDDSVLDERASVSTTFLNIDESGFWIGMPSLDSSHRILLI